MQTLFGKMPIEQLNAVQIETGKSKYSSAILLLGGITIFLGITTIILYKQNIEFKRKINLTKDDI